MNEKTFGGIRGNDAVLSKRKAAACLFCMACLLCGCATGGGTRPAVVATDESVVASQIGVERIEAIRWKTWRNPTTP